MAYVGERLDVAAFIRDVSKAAEEDGFQVHQTSYAGRYPQLVLTRELATRDAPKLYISAGVHGDEPAGPLAVLELIKGGTLSDRFGWTIFPLICPENMVENRRESAGGLDPNRDFRYAKTQEVQAQLQWLNANSGYAFEAAFLLHEDWESPGFYMYEQCSLERATLAEVMMQAAEPICGLNPLPVIEGLEADKGLISFRGREPEIEDWPESIYLMKRGAWRSHTLETPSCMPMQRRVACHCAVVTKAIAALEAMLQ